MQQIVFDIKDDKDASLLIAIVQKLGIRKFKVIGQKNIRGDLNRKIEKGADISSFGEPVNWQKTTRKDRTLIQNK